MKTVTLYRPVGIKELQLIEESGWKEFPPRLFWQPIFYPVLNQPYAEQIANDWNTQDEASGYCGIVTRFDLAEEHYMLYQPKNVGGDLHNELWVPAEHLEEFNRNIIGPITIVNAFFGEKFEMPVNGSLNMELSKFL